MESKLKIKQFDAKTIYHMILENGKSITTYSKNNQIICELGVKDGFYYFNSKHEYKLFSTIDEAVTFKMKYTNNTNYENY